MIRVSGVLNIFVLFFKLIYYKINKKTATAKVESQHTAITAIIVIKMFQCLEFIHAGTTVLWLTLLGTSGEITATG